VRHSAGSTIAFARARSRRQRGDAADPGIEALGDALDHAALAGGITPFEDDDHFELFMLHPILQLDQFALEPKQLLEIDRTGERRTVVMDRMDCSELFEMAFV
jgi:hypothetical protein